MGRKKKISQEAPKEKEKELFDADWSRFRVVLRRGKWVARFPHPTDTQQRTKGGRTYEEPREVVRVLKFVDGRYPESEEEIRTLAGEVYRKVQYDRLSASITGPEKELTPEGIRERHRIIASLDEWLAGIADDNTRRSYTSDTRAFRAFIEKTLPDGYLDELNRQHARDLYQVIKKLKVQPLTKQRKWSLAWTFIRWAAKDSVGRLDTNPWAGLVFDPFYSLRQRDRTLEDEKTFVYRAEREKLLAACRNTMERLWLLMYCLVGLRRSEPLHLRWRDWKRHSGSHHFLAVRHDPGRRYKVKTGERLVPVIYPEVVDLLRVWYEETPYGNADTDWIFAHGPGRPYQQPPAAWLRRLRKTGIAFTPLVGRHTAASILPLYSEHLTGRPWTQIEHSQYFGHRFAVSTRYYIANQLHDLKRLEGLDASEREGDQEPDAEDETRYEQGGFDVALARDLLARLLVLTKAPRTGVAEAIGVSEAAIRKFERSGPEARLPAWFWPAIRCLVNHQRGASSSAPPDRHQ